MLAELVLDCRNMHGEGIQWDALTANVWWTDIEGGALHWFSPESRQAGSFALPDRLCAFAPRRQGGWIFEFASGIELWDGAFRHERRLHEFEPGNRETRLNDGRTDRQGRFVVDGMNEVSGTPNSSVIRINQDLGVETLFTGVSCANATCFSPDGTQMYFADTPERSIRAYGYGDRLALPQTFCDLSGEPGLPDGSCIDAEGGMWNAAWEGGQVVRIDRIGKITHRISVPVPKVTCCAFGGAALDRLFITTSRLGSSADDLERYPLSGSLFEFRPAIRGVEDLPFAA